MKIMITGANGHLGLQIMQTLNRQRPDVEIRAVVRSQRAASTIESAGIKASISIVDYTDAAALSKVAEGCQAIVHLVGIIKESASNTFQNAHERPAEALLKATGSAERLIALSIVGSDSGSSNACLASRGRADEIFLSGKVPATIIRVPMVLGPDDYASMALGRNARKSVCFSFRAGSLEQPIYSGDVIKAVIAALDIPPKPQVLTLAGPESLSRRQLIQRAARQLGGSPSVISLPIALGYFMAMIFETVSSNPPVTRAMLGVLDHDDRVDSAEALEVLSISLTPLDDMLVNVLS